MMFNFDKCQIAEFFSDHEMDREETLILIQYNVFLHPD